MDRRRVAPFRTVLLTRLGPRPSWTLPLDYDQTWLLDPDDPIPILLDRLARWTRELPMPWIVAIGEAAAPLTQLGARRLDLRIAGVSLIAPQDWTDGFQPCPLSLAPMPCSVLVLANRPGNRSLPSQRLVDLARGWRADFLPDPVSDPDLFHRKTQAAMAQRAAAMPLDLQAELAWARAKARRDFPSSTPDIASRTSSMVSRTGQVASSRQSEQGT